MGWVRTQRNEASLSISSFHLLNRSLSKTDYLHLTDEKHEAERAGVTKTRSHSEYLQIGLAPPCAETLGALRAQLTSVLGGVRPGQRPHITLFWKIAI